MPKYLAVLGLIGYVLLATSSMPAISDIDLGIIVTLHVFLFEVVLGVYLIVKGFRPSDSAPGSACKRPQTGSRHSTSRRED